MMKLEGKVKEGRTRKDQMQCKVKERVEHAKDGNKERKTKKNHIRNEYKEGTERFRLVDERKWEGGRDGEVSREKRKLARKMSTKLVKEKKQ